MQESTVRISFGENHGMIKVAVVKVMVCSTQALRTFSVTETFSVPKTRLSRLSHLPEGH